MQSEPPKILLVEDDPILGKQTKELLEGSGYEVSWARGERPLSASDFQPPLSAVVLDISLPSFNGIEMVQQLRATGNKVPVIFLSALSEVEDRVRGFRAGGDDYLTKPFASAELLARLEALLRRSKQLPQIKGWIVDPLLRKIHSSKSAQEFQPREWALLQTFLQNDGRVLTKGYLLEHVWDVHVDPGTNVVDVMICKLRAKLDALGGARIETLRGQGYLLCSDA